MYLVRAFFFFFGVAQARNLCMLEKRSLQPFLVLLNLIMATKYADTLKHLAKGSLYFIDQ